MEYKFSELAKLNYGKSKKKVESLSGNYPIMGTGGLIGYATEYLYDNPSVLIGRKGSIQNIYYLEQPFWTIDTLFYTEINTQLVTPKFFYYKLKTIDFMLYDEGTSIPSLRTQTINDITLNIPSIVEQKVITSILNLFDQKIEVNNKIIDNLEEQAQAIFKSWFVDFEPFQDDEFIDSELGLIPEGWEVKKLGDLSKKIITGKTPSTKNKDYYGDYLPFIKIPDMHGNVYVVDVETRLSKDGMLSQKNKILPTNTICVSCIATVGLVSLVSTESQTNQQINSVIPKEKVSYCYLYCALTDKYKYLNAIGSSGSTTKNVNKRTFGNLKIIYPGEKPMEKFHNICSPFFDIIKKLQFQNKKLEQIRDSLLPKLMSGEIDVSELNIDTKGR